MTGRRPRRIALAAMLAALLAPAMPVGAWGPTGHGAIGVLALERIGPEARQRLAELLGRLDEEGIAAHCNWPDAYRDSAPGEWSAPLHYVNIPWGRRSYDADRDCPNGRCVVAAVNRYAAQLADEDKPTPERIEAFSFLCHFTGDLHQPLHVAYAEDRGGNLRSIRYRGRQTNLHAFWDSALVHVHAPSREHLQRVVQARAAHPEKIPWTPEETKAWANESFTFTRLFAYPQGNGIDAGFEERSWNVARQQIDAAATRLASILEVAMRDGDPP